MDTKLNFKNYVNESKNLMDKAYFLPMDSHERNELEYSASEIAGIILTDREYIQDTNPYDIKKYPMLNRQYQKGLIDHNFNNNQKYFDDLLIDNKLTSKQIDSINYIILKLDSFNPKSLKYDALKKLTLSTDNAITKALGKDNSITPEIKKNIMGDLVKITKQRIKERSNDRGMSL